MNHVHCCDMMARALSATCDEHPDPWDCPDALVTYSPVFDEYGLIVHDGGSSAISIAFCPWCGVALPESKRDRWFDEVEELGHDGDSDDLPAKYRSDAWWRDRGAAGQQGVAADKARGAGCKL
jgi:hypothetical protein